MKSPKSSKRPSRRLPVTIRQISGHSMLPVLPPGTLVYGWRWFARLKPGDVVIFFHNGKEKIKRITAIRGKKLYVVGDHEADSSDSRQFGWLDFDDVIAKIIWPRAPRDRAEGVDSS